MTQDLYYYETGYIDTSYFVYTADVEATVTSSSSLTATVGVIKEVSSSLQANFTQTSIISHIEGADLFAMSNAALEAAVDRIRNNNIEASSAFTISTNGQRIRYVSSEEDSAFTINAVNLRVRYNEAAIDAAFSLSATSSKIQEGAGNLTSNASQTIEGYRVRFVETALTTSSSLAADVTRIPGGTSVEANGTWTSNFSLTAVITNLEGADLSAFSNASISATVDKFTGISAGLNANSNISVQTLRIQSSVVSLQSNVTLSSLTQLNSSLSSNLTATSTTNATALRIQDFTVSFTGAFTPTLTVDVFKNSFAVLESQATISANTIVNKSFISSLTSTSSVSATVQKLKIASANFNSAFSLSAPYLSFTNKHPHSLYYVGTLADGAGISSAQKYVGTYSYYTGSSSSTSQSLQIASTNATFINAGQDFIISVQIRPTDLGNVSGTSDQILIDAGNWAIGYQISGGLTRPVVYYKADFSSSYTRISTTGFHYFNANKWNSYELKRSGSTLTATFYNSTDGSFSTSVSFSGYIAGPGGNTTKAPVYFNALRSTIGVYYDEIFFAKGVSSVSSYTGPGAIDDGALTTTEWLFNFENGYRDQTTGKQLGSAALTSSSSLTALTTLNKTAAATLNSISTVTADATRIKQADATLSSNGFVAVAVGRIRPFVDIEVATFTLTAEGSKTKQASATLSATTDLTSQLVKIASAQSNLNVNSSLDVSFVHNVEFISTESSTFSVSCDANRLRETTTSLENTVDLTALPEVTRTTSATFVSNTTQAIQYTRVRETTVSAQAFASELVVLARVLRSFANLEIKSTLTAVISVTSSRIKADLVANCSVNIDADKISGLKANLVSQSALLAITGVKVSFSANLSCQGFVLTSGIVINLDDSAVWIIPYENTIWQVTEESQTEEIIYLVPSETRAWVISNEPNDYTVAFEDRSYKLRG